MGLIDRLAVREGPPSIRRREEAPAQTPECRIAEPYEDDPLSAARGAVYGVLLGAIMWGVILWLLV